MSAFEIPVRAIRGLLSVALLSAVACGGNAFQSNGAAGSGGGTATAGASGGGVAGGSTAGAGAGGISSGGSSSAGAGAGGTDMQSCLSNTDCEVISKDCCGCGTEPVSSYIAINSVYATQYQSSCGAVRCAPCQGSPSLDIPVNYYVATCARPVTADLPGGGVAFGPGHCVVVDLRATDVTACKVSSDCSLRAGTGCCGGCGGGLPVAINSSQEPVLEQDVCGNEPTACNDCAPVFSGYDATCSDGRCSVELAVGPQPCPCPD